MTGVNINGNPDVKADMLTVDDVIVMVAKK
jgi:hypothetical protein